MSDNQNLKFITLSLLMSWAVACEEPTVQIPEGALQEQTVDLEGQWQVVRAYLDQVDISHRFDFSQVMLSLQMSGGPTDFLIEAGTAPFPVLQNGTWSYNDLTYPTSIQLMVPDASRILDFASPPISGDVSFSLSFGLGCVDHIYTYDFQRM